MPQQQDEAAQVYEAQEVFGFVFVARRDSSKAQQPCEEALDLPPALVPTQCSTVLFARSSSAPHRTDQFDVFFAERDFELRAVVGFIADELLRLVLGEAFGDRGIDEAYFVAFT